MAQLKTMARFQFCAHLTLGIISFFLVGHVSKEKYNSNHCFFKTMIYFHVSIISCTSL